MKTLRLVVLLAFILLPSARAQEVRFFRVVGPRATTITAFSADGYITWTNVATNATFTIRTVQSLLGPSNWIDYVKVPAPNPVTTHRLFDPHPPTNMVLIPAGSFKMGNCMDPSEGNSDELPLHTVYVSALYMDRYEVTKALWDEVKAWNSGNGYSYDYNGAGKAANHPVHTICWYDMVKWCNARSQKEGLMPCYHTDAGMTAIYKTGQVAPYVKWNANGYRLPTEAEWEKAARGGASEHRFPWAAVDTISHSHANYQVYAKNGTNYYTYDVSPTKGFHPTFATGAYPYTSPVGYFAPNAYGLYDMAGNVWERCWDWYEESWYSNADAAQNNPRGPAGPLDFRVLHGGGWSTYAVYSRCALRSDIAPDYASSDIGFRCVRGL